MAASAQFSEESDANGIQWLFAELRRGSALLDLADLTSNSETRRQTMAEAEKTYRSVAGFTPHACSSASQEIVLLQQLEQLRLRLAFAGYYTLLLPVSLGCRLLAIRALIKRI
jgi:hypothetical protein